jgi:hypothetical protein
MKSSSRRSFVPKILRPDSDGDGKPDYRIMTAQTTLKTFFDLSFTFEVIDGQPVVRAASPK